MLVVDTTELTTLVATYTYDASTVDVNDKDTVGMPVEVTTTVEELVGDAMYDVTAVGFIVDVAVKYEMDDAT